VLGAAVNSVHSAAVDSLHSDSPLLQLWTWRSVLLLSARVGIGVLILHVLL
jgi:hypothetical protein